MRAEHAIVKVLTSERTGSPTTDHKEVETLTGPRAIAAAAKPIRPPFLAWG